MPFLAPTEAEALGCCPRTLLSDDRSCRNTQTAAALRLFTTTDEADGHSSK